MKNCSICGELKPLTDFYSQLRKTGHIYYQPDCKVCTGIRALQWQEDNHERRLEIQRKANMTPNSQVRQKKNSKNQLKKGTQRIFHKNNPDKAKKYNKKREPKNLIISDVEWLYCLAYFENRCAYCYISWHDHYELNKQDLHGEHVDHEGANDLSNCVPSCGQCNSEKNQKYIFNWYNIDNHKYSEQRKNKILNWINGEYKKYYKETIIP